MPDNQTQPDTLKNKAIASLVFGGVSLLTCCWGLVAILGVIAGVFGLVLSLDVLGQRQTAEGRRLRVLSVAGLLLSSVGLVAAVIVLAACGILSTVFKFISRLY